MILFSFQETTIFSMGLLLRVCILLSATLLVINTERNLNDIKWFLRNNPSIFRRKRASFVYLPVHIAAREGKRAVQKLLQGAKESPSYTFGFKNFEKPGGYETALQEFRSLEPKGVVEFGGFDGSDTDIIVGMVGDRNVILKKQGNLGKPCIDIIKLRPESAYHVMDIITYVD